VKAVAGGRGPFPRAVDFQRGVVRPVQAAQEQNTFLARISPAGNPLHVAEVDIDAAQKMANDFVVEVIPTLILLNGDGKIISRQTGFMEAGDLMRWLQTGRKRAAAGQWEGTVPAAPLDELIKKSAADNLGTNDLQRLVELLGDADPANRDQAGKILLAQRENAIPALILAVGNPYLGERIGAGDLLPRLAPDLNPIDPWQSPLEMSNTVVALQKWWADAGHLPATATPRQAVSSPENSIKEALDRLGADDPVRRTEAMTELVSLGADALSALRTALQRAGRNGDQRALGLLEDVRWTILVPDAIEQQSGGVRNILARGKSSERQAAAERLGRMGKDALGILTELTGDSDPLVVESTVRALSRISGADSVSALATLLQSPDSNLRMTAAQALGHTKNQLALKPLLATANDPDEVVACTALSGIEELNGRESYDRTPRDLPGEIADRLKLCMADPRWRVRAAAAEVAGKLNIGGLTGDLKKLLGDDDGFVVKNALTALAAMNAAPDPAQLISLSKRLPSLQGDVVELMLASASDDAVKSTTDLFNSGTTETRIAILGAFLRRGVYDNAEADEGWKPMLAQAIAAPEPRLRHLAAEVLLRRSPKLAVPMVGPLLADQDRDTRQAAVNLALQILAQDYGGFPGRRPIYETSFSSSSSSKTNQPLVNAEQLGKWHAAMLKQLDPAPGLSLAAAIFATGDGKTDVPMLLAALAGTNSASVSSPVDKENMTFVMGAVMPKLVLPADRPVLEKLLASPGRFAMAVSQNARCQPEVSDYLLEPSRFKSALEQASGADLIDSLELLAGYDYGNMTSQWSFWSENDRTKVLALALVNSTNAAWRAAAVFSLGLRIDARDDLAIFDKALVDPNPWVRGSAVRAIARNIKDRPGLENDLAPLLADTNLLVAAAAAVALLEPETRAGAGLDEELKYFEFQTVRGGRESFLPAQNDDRPLSVLEGKPLYLQPARNWLAATNLQESVAFALLLAQFGDFSGVDKLVPQLAELAADDGEKTADPVLAGIALSHDIKYLPALKQMAAVRHDEPSLRKVLQAMKGMSGPDARQLRLDINKKIRNSGSASGMTE
jgi:HEAT repeat protein